MKEHRPLGWTTLEEAKLLVKAGLDPNTADMRYEENNYELLDEWVAYPFGGDIKDFDVLKKEFPNSVFYPCWSLGALKKLIPDEIKVNDVWFYFYCSYNGVRKWCASYVDENFKRLVRFNMFSSQIEMFHEIVLFLLENNHIKKQE